MEYSYNKIERDILDSAYRLANKISTEKMREYCRFERENTLNCYFELFDELDSNEMILVSNALSLLQRKHARKNLYSHSLPVGLRALLEMNQKN